MGAGEFILTIFVSFCAGTFFGVLMSDKAEKYVKEEILSQKKEVSYGP